MVVPVQSSTNAAGTISIAGHYGSLEAAVNIAGPSTAVNLTTDAFNNATQAVTGNNNTTYRMVWMPG